MYIAPADGRELRRNYVPAEYRGLARQLISRVAASVPSIQRHADVLLLPIERRHQRRPGRPVRQDMLIDLVRAWRSMAPEFRLSITPELANRRSFSLTELRLWNCDFRLKEWGDNATMQRALSICRISLTIDDKSYSLNSELLVTVGLHALARYYQRSGKRDLDSLKVALLPLCTSSALRSVPCPGGRWIGDIIVSRDEGSERMMRVRGVSTFISSDDDEYYTTAKYSTGDA